MLTQQMGFWSGEFGKEYTDRNALSLEDLDALYNSYYGITRVDLNAKFLEGISATARILEVGANVGNQLLCLQKMGFQNLYGIELQDYAVELSKTRTQHINLIQGSAFDIPYKDGFFDLVFTSGVLIHLDPANIKKALQEIHRCTSTYIWGHEYYAPEYTEIQYRGHSNVLWKADFAQLYLDSFDDLTLVKREKFPYLENDNIDEGFLLKKL